MGEPRAKRVSGVDPAADLSRLCQAITEHSPLPMAEVEGANHVVRYVNPAFCRMIDTSKEELVGKPFGRLLPDMDHCTTLLDRVRRTRRPVSHAGQPHSKSNPGFWSYMMWPVLAVGREAGVVVQVTETAHLHEKTLAMNEALILGSVRQHELTEAADASNAVLAAVDVAKDNFIAMLSHELRSPLSVIVLWSQLLRRSGKHDDSLLKGLEVIDRSSKALAKLIEDLLDVQRISSGKLRLDLAEVDLAEITRSVVDSMAPAATEKGIRIERTIELAPARMSGDPARLQQVLGNLLGNAVKFTPKGGRIRFALRRKGTRVEIEVSDTGKGINALALPHIFERFRQEGSQTNSAHGGLGLGLSIARQLVELHGGTLTAESAGVDKGATFTVSLPLAAGRRTNRRPPVSVKEAAAATPQSLGGALVLVVDEEPDSREALLRVLAEADANAIVVGSTDEALEALRQQQPDVILCDIGLPERDGSDLVRAIRALPPERGGRIPAIALTAYAASELRERSSSACFQAHLAKPLEPAKLIAAVAALVHRSPPGAARGGRRSKKRVPGG